MLTIFVVSDATGETAERVVRSALVQFEEAPARVIRRGQVRTATQLRAVV
ncbi:MAG: kinase/pyrophosphorylase, partial [Candidatus Binatia bacterium]